MTGARSLCGVCSGYESEAETLTTQRAGVGVCPGLETSDRTVSALLELCTRMGKQGVECLDSPGFVVNRLLVPMLNEAIFAVFGAKKLRLPPPFTHTHPYGLPRTRYAAGGRRARALC
jgi:hypothetical protein